MCNCHCGKLGQKLLDAQQNALFQGGEWKPISVDKKENVSARIHDALREIDAARYSGIVAHVNSKGEADISVWFESVMEGADVKPEVKQGIAKLIQALQKYI